MVVTGRGKAGDRGMKDFYNKCVQNLLYGGIKKEEYQEIQEQIMEVNRSSLSTASLCLFLMFAGLLLGSLLSDMMVSNRIAYEVVGLSFLAIWLLCLVMKRRGKRFILLLWYVAFTIMCIYGIVLSTVIHNDISATTFCLIILVAPLLYTDHPCRVFVYFSIVTVSFIILNFQKKSFYLAYSDMVNALCSVFIGGVIHFRVIRTKLREMMQRRHIEEERDTDKLTGCMTKSAFEREIVEKLCTRDPIGVLMVMDLDRFKSINDNYGHVYGDLVLSTMGEYFSKSFPDTAMVGRFGGDEFQIWLPGRYDRKEIVICLDALLKDVNSIETPDGKLKIGLSIGISVSPRHGNQYQTLFENADAALYSAKNMGRNRYVFCPDI